MEIDWKAVRARFAAMTREELLEEAALRADEYTPQAQRILEGEALERGIAAGEIQRLRQAGAPEPEVAVAAPALLTSSDHKEEVRSLARALREQGVPAVVKELDPRAFHCSGHRVGRWGLMVAGAQAARAAALLEGAARPAGDGDGDATCGAGCGSCGGSGEPPGEEWDEDGDWWKGSPDEDEPGGGRAGA